MLPCSLAQKNRHNKGQSEPHPCATHPATSGSPSEPSPGRRAPRDRRRGGGGGACQLAALDDETTSPLPRNGRYCD